MSSVLCAREDLNLHAVAIGDKVRVPIAPTVAATDYVPAMTTSAGADATAASVEVEITANKSVSWHLTGEQIRSIHAKFHIQIFLQCSQSELQALHGDLNNF
jgi:hypothetical protein